MQTELLVLDGTAAQALVGGTDIGIGAGRERGEACTWAGGEGGRHWGEAWEDTQHLVVVRGDTLVEGDILLVDVGHEREGSQAEAWGVEDSS